MNHLRGSGRMQQSISSGLLCLRVSPENVEVDETKEIGRGRFGTVYRGLYHLKRKEKKIDVAVKRLEEIYDHEGTYRFLNEVSLPNKFEHPVILPVLGMMLSPPTIITEYMPNGSLENMLARKWNGSLPDGFSPVKISCCFYGIADALVTLHEHQNWHRDVKPANILLDELYYPRLCDYGFTKHVKKDLLKKLDKIEDSDCDDVNEDDIGLTGGLGSPLYKAPELYTSDVYTEKVDVYAFGVTMYRCLAADNVFMWNDGTYVRKITKNTAELRLEDREEIPRHFWDLITRCWHQESVKRPNFREIRQTLRNSKFCLEPEKLAEYEAYIKKLEKRPEGPKPRPRPASRIGSGGHFDFKRILD